jgi:RNA polymerase sigma factor (sigma-70 family)
MLTTQSSALTRVVRTLPLAEAGESDGRLLARFVESGDEVAFRELVRRLGPMVLGVCRRGVGDVHLAEDAFQAAFLVLARRAADVRPREAVRGWLYGIATRTARKARAMSARQRTHEALVPCAPDRGTEPGEGPDPDLLRMLDEEIGALSEHMRVAVVLCELDGVSRKDAALRLGIPLGTLSSRLAKARRVLAERLRKRGAALTLAGLSSAFERLASAAVFPSLAAAAAALVNRSVLASAIIAELSQGVMKTMFLAKLKVAVLAVLLLTLAGWAMGPSADPAAPPTADRPAKAEPDDNKARPPGPGTLLFARGDEMVTLTPEGKPGIDLPIPKGATGGYRGRLSPDGKRAAYLVAVKPPAGTDGSEPWPYELVITKLGSDKPLVVNTPATRIMLAWTADGSRVVVTKWSGEVEKGEDADSEVGVWSAGITSAAINPDTGRSEPLALPKGAWVLDAGRNNKEFLVKVYRDGHWVMGFATVGDAEIKGLIRLKEWTGDHVARLSPDGKRVLYTDADPKDRDANKWGASSLPYILDVATRKRTELDEFPDKVRCHGVAWSPDGRRVAYTWEQLHYEDLKKDTVNQFTTRPTRVGLVVSDADGSNPTRIATAKEKMIFGSVDWR